VWLWPDHLTCPDLERWLPVELEDSRVRTHVMPPGAGWKLPAELRALSERWPTLEDDDDALDALVVFAPLGSAADASVVSSLRAGGRIVEVATVARPFGWWVRPWTWKTRAARDASLRIVHWARAGLFDLEQYIALTPADAVVTLGVAATN
jgi:hypothetical protein